MDPHEAGRKPAVPTDEGGRQPVAALIRESFTQRRNLRPVLIALAMVAAQSFIGYVSTFYALTLLTSSLKVGAVTANTPFSG